MRNDFAIFILTHGRPDKQITLATLAKAGYTGKTYLVIDDEDKQADEYKSKYGNMVLQFSKQAEALKCDGGDNLDDRRTILYARNAGFDLARKLGIKYFLQLDDDYQNFEYTVDSKFHYRYIKISKTFNQLIDAWIEFYEATPALSIALGQGGDFLGGAGSVHRLLRRKAMNSFLCSVERPFQFRGRLNEDVNTYTVLTHQGKLFFSLMHCKLVQMQTQASQGGITELYKKMGTYAKSFYTVMMCPSAVKVSDLGDYKSPHFRIHHKINWERIAPKILDPRFKKIT